MKLLIGCPVAKRAWIIPDYLFHVEEALGNAGIEDAQYIFLADPEDETVDAIVENCDRPLNWVFRQEGKHGRTWDQEGGRTWNPDRYEYMVEIRNALLAKVRQLQPDLFFSLDSDILIHPDMIDLLVKGCETYDAVGARCFMTTTGNQFPSYAMLNGNMLLRKDVDCGPMPVDVIMAAKMMNPSAYNVDYLMDVHGEDVGWSRNCAAQGLKLGWEGRIVSKHVMSESWLEKTDRRCGY